MYSPLAVILILAFMLWFAAGIQWNLRKGNAMLRWLQSGLPMLGKRTTLRWLGSSVVELKITDPTAPFLEAEVLVVLEPRDIGPLWGWGRLHGRRDFLIVRARLEQPPRFEIEVGDRRGWTGRDALDRLALQEWRQADWGNPHIQVAYSGERAPEVAQRLWQAFQVASGGIWRLSVRRTRPHLEVHVIPPDVTVISAERLFRAFRDLSAAVV